MFYKGTEWIRAGPDWKGGQVSSNGEDTPKHFLYQLDKAEGHICQNVIILLLLLYILTQSYADKVLAWSKYFDSVVNKTEKEKDINLIYEHI